MCGYLSNKSDKTKEIGEDMKIIEPSATIIEDELSQLSIYQRIAYCAGVCYQREPNKTEEEAQEFCRKMVRPLVLQKLFTIHSVRVIRRGVLWQIRFVSAPHNGPA